MAILRTNTAANWQPPPPPPAPPGDGPGTSAPQGAPPSPRAPQLSVRGLGILAALGLFALGMALGRRGRA